VLLLQGRMTVLTLVASSSGRCPAEDILTWISSCSARDHTASWLLSASLLSLRYRLLLKSTEWLFRCDQDVFILGTTYMRVFRPWILTFCFKIVDLASLHTIDCLSIIGCWVARYALFRRYIWKSIYGTNTWTLYQINRRSVVFALYRSTTQTKSLTSSHLVICWVLLFLYTEYIICLLHLRWYIRVSLVRYSLLLRSELPDSWRVLLGQLGLH
jgi:hypothetical protein